MTLKLNIRTSLWLPLSRQITVPLRRVQALTIPHHDYDRCHVIVRGIGECHQNRYPTDMLRQMLAKKANIELIPIEEHYIRPNAVAALSPARRGGCNILLVGGMATLYTEWSAARIQQLIRSELRHEAERLRLHGALAQAAP